MAARRIKRWTLTCQEFNEMVARAGGVSNETLTAYTRDATHVSDLSVIEVAQAGDKVEVYVESATFPELSCCYKKSAPEWLATFQGGR